MIQSLFRYVVVVSTLSLTSVFAAPPRDYVTAIGSSTAYPFATVVAEHIGKTTAFKAPRIESIGSGVGIMLFCNGTGPDFPDLALASRRMTVSEDKDCQQNDVNSITEIKFGYDGITIANSRKAPKFALSAKDLFLALAKEVPDPKNLKRLIPNPYREWNVLNASLPTTKIRVYGPPPSSGTRDVFVELAMEKGCQQFELIRNIKKKDPQHFRQICYNLREDGAYIEAGESDNLIVKKLIADPQSVGIFGFNFFDRNRDRIQAAKIDGIAPTWESIFDHSYILSRPLFLYIKDAHVGVIPGLNTFIKEFTSDQACGEEGYLSYRGLIPLSEEERRQMAAKVKVFQ